MKRPRRGSIAFSAICALLLVLSSCGDAAPREKTDLPQEIPQLEDYSDYPVAASIEDMWAQADFVVIGEFEKLEKTWNMYRNPANPEEESQEDRFEGQIFSFSVETTLKGNGVTDAILVNLPYLETIHGAFSNAKVDENGMLLEEATETYPYRVERLWDYYIEPVIGQRYMLFLRYGEASGRYFPAVEPHMILICEDDTVFVESNLLLSEEELRSRKETVYQMDNGSDFRFISHAFDETFQDGVSGGQLSELLRQLEQD